VSPLTLILTVFLACAVEGVEALTVVLAAGTGRHWRSALQGAGAALLALAAVVGALGPAVAQIPLGALRAAVGTLLLLFGLQWLRKAVLRASGWKDQRDEAAAFAKGLAASEQAPVERRGRVRDWYAFTVAFKGVALEGLEVAFIVVTFGGSQHDVPLAALGAVLAVVVVAGVGFAVRAPLARVPENTVKFVVGTLLTAFGLFWSAEGVQVRWPGSDAALLVLAPAVALLALGYTRVLIRAAARTPAPALGPAPTAVPPDAPDPGQPDAPDPGPSAAPASGSSAASGSTVAPGGTGAPDPVDPVDPAGPGPDPDPGPSAAPASGSTGASGSTVASGSTGAPDPADPVGPDPDFNPNPDPVDPVDPAGPDPDPDSAGKGFPR
jgi:uncharacterized membrane protein